MAKSQSKYLISYNSLLGTFQKGKVPNNILLSIREKVLLDELVSVICQNFGGKNFDSKNNLLSYNAEDKPMENVLSECSNIGLFSEKKVVVLRNVRKLLKDAKLSLLDYLSRSNPDACLIMTSADEEFAVDKIFLSDSKSKDSSDNAGVNKKIIDQNVKIYQIEEFTEGEKIKWIEEKFGDFQITKETIKYFLQFTNNSLDEILSEIEKLMTYCYHNKEITAEDVNVCNGISKSFSEIDFIKAIIEKKDNDALKIYDHISLKKESEVFLIFLLSTAFTAINKLMDPAAARLDGFNLKRELNLWFPEQEKLMPYYKSLGKSIKPETIAAAIGYIYSTDKLLKTSGGDKKTMMVSLINNLCRL